MLRAARWRHRAASRPIAARVPRAATALAVLAPMLLALTTTPASAATATLEYTVSDEPSERVFHALDGATLDGDLHVYATMTRAQSRGISRVVLREGTDVLWTQRSWPYGDFDPVSLPDGIHTVHAEIVHDDGTTTTSAPATFRVGAADGRVDQPGETTQPGDTAQPRLEYTISDDPDRRHLLPLDGQSVSSPLHAYLTVDPAAADDITRVVLREGSQVLWTQRSWPFGDNDPVALPDGAHTVSADISYADGSTGSATASFTVATAGSTPEPSPEPAPEPGAPVDALPRALEPTAVDASDDDGNVPANAVDGDLDTRWSAKGDGQWIAFDLGSRHTVTELEVVWYRGDTRSSRFDVETSPDGVTWSTVHSGASSGDTTAFEQVRIDRDAQHVRIVGHGNSSNSWNSINEVVIRGVPVEGGAAPDPDPTERPEPAGEGIWISTDEIMALPTSGQAYERVLREARGSWGEANIGSRGRHDGHDVSTLAGALIAVRTDDDAMATKTHRAIMSLLDSGYDEVLDVARSLGAYVIAADVLDNAGMGLSARDEAAFRSWLEQVRTRDLPGHGNSAGPADSLLGTAKHSNNNWGTQARQSMIAIDLYLGTHPDDLADVATVTARYAGEDNGYEAIAWSSTSWHADPSDRVGINRRGATISGRDVDGVLPEEQRRTDDFAWPAPRGTYPYTGLQGIVASHVMLQRAGLMPFDAGDDAIVRALTWLEEVNGNSPPGHSCWISHVVNHYADTSLEHCEGGTGSNMDWTDWTHG